MKKRWLCLFVENEIGVLAKISGLFSGKSYNLDSLTVGITEDKTVSRMTISLTSDDRTFEQIKKQLNRSVEVIKVIDYERETVLMESVKPENQNNKLIALLGKCFANRVEIVRGGSVAVEALSVTGR